MFTEDARGIAEHVLIGDYKMEESDYVGRESISEVAPQATSFYKSLL